MGATISSVRAQANESPAVDYGQNIVHTAPMKAISYSEARDNLKSVIDKVVADRAPIAITRQRGEGAVLISESEWASIEETLYLLRSPRNAARLLEAVRGFEAGEEPGIALE
jgi:antitoxin YefM